MGTNLWVNNAVKLTSLCYKMFGTRGANFLIETFACPIFTSGRNIPEMITDRDNFLSKNIYGVGNYVVEGLKTMDVEKIDSIEEEIR